MSAEPFAIRQAVVLCGGLGSRLGALTASVPKPLLPVGDRPFLERLLFEVRRHGVTRVLLLAAFQSAAVETFARDTSKALGLAIDVAVEPERAGTGGALWHARAALDERFFLFNGDSWFDINLLDLALVAARRECPLTLALRMVPDVGRYGAVELVDGRVRPLASGTGPGLVNAGVYVVDRGIVDLLQPKGSFEDLALQSLPARGQVAGVQYDGFFIDIGVPDDFERAQTEIPARQRRRALFLDRDGVLNEDLGHVGEVERFVWRNGARQAVKMANDAGCLVFVVTNQAGVAKGYYPEEAVGIVHTHVQDELAASGAHIDDFRYCPFHEAATVAAYRKASDWRKPEPGMILDLLRHWPVDVAGSLMIGDQDSDVHAGRAAGLQTLKVDGTASLVEIVASWLGGERR